MEYLDKAITFKAVIDDMLSQSDWIPVALDDNIKSTVTMDQKHFDGFPLSHYRANTIVNISKDRLCNMEWNMIFEEAKLYETNITEYSVLEENNNLDYKGVSGITIDSPCKIKRQVNSLPFPFNDRESIFAQYMFIDDSSYIIGFSVDHPSAPLTDEFVRTTIPITAFKFTTLGENRTLVQRLVNVDPNGYIPEFIIRSQAHKLTEALYKLHELT